MAKILWRPNQINDTHMMKFMDRVNNVYDLDIVWKKKYGNKFHRFKVQTIEIVKLFFKALNFRF